MVLPFGSRKGYKGYGLSIYMQRGLCNGSASVNLSQCPHIRRRARCGKLGELLSLNTMDVFAPSWSRFDCEDSGQGASAGNQLLAPSEDHVRGSFRHDTLRLHIQFCLNMHEWTAPVTFRGAVPLWYTLGDGWLLIFVDMACESHNLSPHIMMALL